MAVPASRLSRLADKAREHADEIEAVALNTTGPAIKTAPATQKDDSFDVWSHTVAGAHGASKERPADAWKAAAESPSREWARADSDAVGASIEQQADDALKKFQLLTKQRKPGPDEEAVEGFLGGLGTTFDILTSLEQMISAPLAMLPFPAFPALRVMDMDIGLPHGHSHPPNLVPPAPMVFLPSTGPIIPIPFLSGATRTLINGLPAGRCGDMGLGVWCGGYFPMYEVFLGSSSVWIEGARAGRLLVDVTRHCIFSAPGPKDPPLGPMVGMTITASPNVLIGGVPMPSLLDMAMGKAIGGLFKGIGKAVKRAKAARAARKTDAVPSGSRNVEDWTFPGTKPFSTGRLDEARMFRRLVHSRFVHGADAFDRMKHAKAMLDEASVAIDRMIRDRKLEIDTYDLDLAIAVRQDLEYLYVNPEGRKVLDRIAAQPHKTRIEPGVGKAGYAEMEPVGPPFDNFWNHVNGRPGSGSSTRVDYDPKAAAGPDCPPDTTLFHELEHAANNAEGRNRAWREVPDGQGGTRWEETDPPPATEKELPGRTAEQREQYGKGRYTNMEEYNTVRKENQYRAQYNQKPRWGHYNMSLMPGA